MMKQLKKTAAMCLILAAAMLNTAYADITVTVDQEAPGTTMEDHVMGEEVSRYSAENLALMKKFNGRWQGSFKVVKNVIVKEGNNTTREYYNDGVIMDFVYDEKDPQLYLRVDSCTANYLMPREWHIGEDGESLVFTFNDKPWQAIVTLRLATNQTLTGTYRQKGQDMAISMRRVLSTPTNFIGTPQFTFEGEGSDVWYERLIGADSYSDTGASIPYTYELGVNAKNRSIDTKYGITKLMKTYKTDVQKMTGLLNLVCDNFRHSGASGMPEKTDAISCIEYAQEAGGIECRGLSSILAEMCRMAGIPAKPVMCIPSNDPCEDCHVVVQAYSQSLGQWVMLDPTYRLILKDAKGRYMNLETLREALIDGRTVIPNDNAGHNGAPFYIEYYRAYMTKNMFRFSNLTSFGFEESNKTGNRENMLLPLGYTIPFLNYRTEKLTTSADAFWAPPPGMEKKTPVTPVTPVTPATPATPSQPVAPQK